MLFGGVREMEVERESSEHGRLFSDREPLDQLRKGCARGRLATSASLCERADTLLQLEDLLALLLEEHATEDVSEEADVRAQRAVGGLPHTSTLPGYSGELQIGLCEVVAEAEQGLPGELRDRIGQTVAEVESRSVPALARPQVSIECRLPMLLREDDALELELVGGSGDERATDHPELVDEHDAGLDECRRPDPHDGRIAQPGERLLETRLLDQDRDECGRVDDHTPSGP